MSSHKKETEKIELVARPDAILRRASVSPFRLLADGYYGQRPVGELMKGEAHR